MFRNCGVSALLPLAMYACVCAAENGAALAAADGSVWQPSKDCSLVLRDGQFVIVSTGDDPYVISTDLPEAAGPFTVELRAKSNSHGPVQIFWTPRNSPNAFSGARHADLAFLHDNEWRDYSVALKTTEIARLRLDPSTAPGEIGLAFMRLKDHAGTLVKEWRLGAGGPPKDPPNANGNARISGAFKGSEIVVTTTARLAGAIHSLAWNGMEFIDSADHGRQLQSATNLDCGTPLQGETYNPTEAGSRDDGAGPFSSSKLLSISALGPELKTTVQMAFWLAPGEKSGGQPAKNATVLSDHLLAKRVHIGHNGIPNIIDYDVTFTIPNERHTFCVIEGVTGYMNPAFKNFYKREPGTGKLSTVDDGPGEQAWPVVFATENGSHAMGIFAPENQPRGKEKAGYGRFRFVHEKVVKWNCVFRIHAREGIKPGDYAYTMFVVVGTLDDVQTGMNALEKEFAEPGK